MATILNVIREIFDSMDGISSELQKDFMSKLELRLAFEDVRVTFGKHKNKMLSVVFKEDPLYVDWLANNEEMVEFNEDVSRTARAIVLREPEVVKAAKMLRWGQNKKRKKGQ
jgi:hypothetical protein